MTSDRVILVEKVMKSYRRSAEVIKVLDNLSLEVASGEFLALMGPSGSGKTTLLNLIGGLDTCDSGSVTVGGVNLAPLREAQLSAWRSRNIGFIFQFYNLLSVLSALENVTLPLTLFDMPEVERRERAAFALEVVGLSDRVKHFPSELSGGQQQRVAIARAIVTDPTLIVADEPTGDLDRTSALEIMNLLTRLNKEFHKSIVMVTHDRHMADFASRVVELDKGQLLSTT